jgi:two-component system OmpR family response regulator
VIDEIPAVSLNFADTPELVARRLEQCQRALDELVTRTMLLESCWDGSYEGLSNLVDVHVGRLRRKLDLPGARPLAASSG